MRYSEQDHREITGSFNSGEHRQKITVNDIVFLNWNVDVKLVKQIKYSDCFIYVEISGVYCTHDDGVVGEVGKNVPPAPLGF